jgi:hypothetical protein
VTDPFNVTGIILSLIDTKESLNSTSAPSVAYAAEAGAKAATGAGGKP